MITVCTSEFCPCGTTSCLLCLLPYSQSSCHFPLREFAFAQISLHKNNSSRFRIVNCISNLIDSVQIFSSSILLSRKSETVYYLFCWHHAAISGAKGSRLNSLLNTIILRTNLWCRHGAHDICESMKSWYASFGVIFYLCQMINSRSKLNSALG